MEQGYSYGTALRKAAQLFHSVSSSSTEDFLGKNISDTMLTSTEQEASENNVLENANHIRILDTDPNTILGIEYIRALYRYHIELDIIPVERTSSHHNPTLGDSLPSGTALRNAIYASTVSEGSASKWYQYLPPIVSPIARDIVQTNYYANLNRYYDMIHLTSRVSIKEKLQTLQDMSDGLEDAWLTASVLSSWEQARASLKSKRYTYARLDRIATYSLLCRTKEMFQECHQQGPTYARLLAFNDRGRQYLREKRASIPIVQKWAPFCQQTTGISKTLCDQDQLASRLWRLTVDNPRYRDSHYDYTTSPVYVQNLI